MIAIIREWEVYLVSLAYLAGTILVGLILSMVALRILSFVLRRRDPSIARSFRKTVRAPLRVLFPLLLLQMVLPSMVLSERFVGLARHILGILSIIGFSWLLLRLALFVEDIVRKRYQLDVKDNLEARKVQTQIRFFRQIVTVAVVIVAFSTILMTFDRVRQLGTSILASRPGRRHCGIRGPENARNLFAGIQIAITQPIRIDDVVIVEGEWGRIEEITLTYVGSASGICGVWSCRSVISSRSRSRTGAANPPNSSGTVYLYPITRCP